MNLLGDARFSFHSHGGFKKSSEAGTNYNCIAWAAGCDTTPWWPVPHGVAYWPPGVPRLEKLASFVAAFVSLGYAECESDSLEDGFEKVAILELDGKPTHAARQIVSGPDRGLWTSKLGKSIDISHSLKAVCGSLYGRVAVVLKRPA